MSTCLHVLGSQPNRPIGNGVTLPCILKRHILNILNVNLTLSKHHGSKLNIFYNNGHLTVPYLVHDISKSLHPILIKLGTYVHLINSKNSIDFGPNRSQGNRVINGPMFSK